MTDEPITRTRSIMVYDPTTMMYASVVDVDMSGDGFPRRHVLQMDAQVQADLGNPGTITLTVHPQDIINNEEWDREVRRVIGEAIGAASVCWHENDAGQIFADDVVFDEAAASQIVGKLVMFFHQLS